MFKFAGILFCAAIFLAGCKSTPSGPPAPLNWTDTNIVRKAPAPHPQKAVTPAPQANVPPTIAWTSLNRWAARHKIAAPRLISSSPVMTYSISSGNGAMTLTIGSLEAMWNGVEIHLGFEPQLIDGEIYLHELDLQKNLEPLLCDPPLKFSANRIIVIDPGHGGSNSGTHSVLDGRFEKEFTLDWAKRLKPLLEQEGWKVFLTRTNDADVSISNRVAFAESHHVDLFISLHFNSAAPDEAEAGIETYCLTPTGMPSTLTRGYADPWSENLPDNVFDALNLQLAVRVQNRLAHETGEEDRGVRRARFIGVLRGETCPSVLIEAGFLSNPREAKLIENPAHRQKLAEALAAALK
ncbi:MAG: N-acetylmuramoyl-L-alanine amidase [Limisphaerales bacterium]